MSAVLQQTLQDQPSVGTEMHQSGVVAMARAQMEARYVMALRNPRVWDVVRDVLITDCKRPAFANNKRTYYVMPYDSKIHGLGIGFVESAIRAMRNISIESKTTFTSQEIELIQVTVEDLESNIPYITELNLERTVERSKPMADGYYVSVRKNSKGHDTYLVPATEEELKDKRASAVSKAIRQGGLRLLPDWLKEECIDIIFQVREQEVAKDPDAARKRMLDAFASIGVKAADLVAYLGHDVGTCAPAQIVKLRGIYDSINSGEFSWDDFAKGRVAPAAAPAGAPAAPAGPARPQSKSAQAAAAGSAPTTTPPPSPAGPQGKVDPSTGEISDPPRPGASAPAAAEPQAPAPGPAAPASSPASEGARRYLLGKAKNQPAALIRVFSDLGIKLLDGKTREEVAKIVDIGDAAAINGLTDAQFTAAKSALLKV